jgi:hypothetical protein
MSSPQLSPEQQEHLTRQIEAIGHNRGPALIEHRDEIIERAARHHRLRAEVIGIRAVAEPFGAVLLDAVVVSFIIASLHGEIEQYVDWRVSRDPSYAAVKRELYGDRKA